MSNQCYKAENRTFTEEGLVEIRNWLDHVWERWKASLKADFAKWPLLFKAIQRSKISSFWIITVLMVFGVFTYYACHTPLVNITLFDELYNAPHDLFRSIFLIPIIYAALVFRVRGSLISSFVFLCVVLPRALLDSPYPDALLRALVFVIITTFVSLLVAVGSNRIDKEKENSKLLQFLSDCMRKQEGEKQHVAREIHDGSLQTLLDISHNIDARFEAEDRKEMKLWLMQLRDKADSVQSGLRQLITGLRPPLLEELGLESSLKWLANEMAEKRASR